MRVYLLLAALLWTQCAWCAQEDTELSSEYRIKAAFLYKFAGFVEWPRGTDSAPDAPLTIGILDGPMTEELERVVQGRTIGTRPIVIKRVEAGGPLPEMQMLFIGRSESGRLPKLAPMLQARSVLVVTEDEGCLSQGSTINFIVVDRRVRFEVSLNSAEKSRLRPSSRLLDVAYKVVGAP